MPRHKPSPLRPAAAVPPKYRWRNLVERLFSKLENLRRVAKRYDKIKEFYLGLVAIASIKLWIPFVHMAWFVTPAKAGLESSRRGRPGLIRHAGEGRV
jgi:hypothetical protein